MAQTYCTQSDIEAIISASGLLACIDDTEAGQASTGATLHVTNAIERAAVKINAAAGRQYSPLSDLASNDWCKWANAVLAAYYLQTRRGNPAWQSLSDQVKEVEELLEEVAWGRRGIPEQPPSFDFRPTVSNFQVEPGRSIAPVRVDRDESTGAAPVDGAGTKRYYANQPGVY